MQAGLGPLGVRLGFDQYSRVYDWGLDRVRMSGLRFRVKYGTLDFRLWFMLRIRVRV